MNSKKDAYLIMAHHNFSQLFFLIDLLDNPLHDLYIHIDRKVDDEIFNDVKNTINLKELKSEVYFVNRFKTYWGSYSLVEVELNLFKSAYFNGEGYRYYHLLSGECVPLAPSEFLYKYFKSSQDLYVEFAKDEQKYKVNRIYERVKCYRLFPNLSEKTINNVLFKTLLRTYRAFEYYSQRLFFVDRIKNMI